MDEETRNELETIKNRLHEVGSYVITLQDLVRHHESDIQQIAEELRRVADVHASR